MTVIDRTDVGRSRLRSLGISRIASMENVEKHPFIIDLIERLQHDLGDNYFVLVDYWDGDLLAQGLGRLGNPHTVVYVLLASALVGDQLEPREGLYCFECEVEPLDPDWVTDAAHTGTDVGYDTLLGVIQHHLAAP